MWHTCAYEVALRNGREPRVHLPRHADGSAGRRGLDMGSTHTARRLQVRLAATAAVVALAPATVGTPSG